MSILYQVYTTNEIYVFSVYILQRIFSATVCRWFPWTITTVRCPEQKLTTTARTPPHNQHFPQQFRSILYTDGVTSLPFFSRKHVVCVHINDDDCMRVLSRLTHQFRAFAPPYFYLKGTELAKSIGLLLLRKKVTDLTNNTET